MNQNLSPMQFARQADAFDKWAKSEIQRHYSENEFEPGHARFDRETGRRVARLREARTWLVDTASASVYEHRNTLGEPLRDLLPQHHDLIHDWEQSRPEA